MRVMIRRRYEGEGYSVAHESPLHTSVGEENRGCGELHPVFHLRLIPTASDGEDYARVLVGRNDRW